MTLSQERLQRGREVADAVLYEGYLLYPYRASSAKNRTRWQFGVLGPPGAQDRALGEPESMTIQTLLTDVSEGARLTAHLRFLQLQRRQLRDPDGADVDAIGSRLSWDEAVEQEVVVELDRWTGRTEFEVAGAEECEALPGGGSVLRTRWPLRAEISTEVEHRGAFSVLTVEVANTAPERPTTREEATRTALLGAHLLVEADGCRFVSVVDPPADAKPLVAALRQDRCWPFLCGDAEEGGGTADLLLGSPIILYDHPQIAPESAGALFDATEIDEILTLRVMTMTGAEKAEARATDPRAAAIIDRCDAMTPEDLQRLHGSFRDPHAEEPPWWDPESDASVDPGADSVLVDGVPVSKGSLVRVHPARRADAQDLFFADQLARVTAVLSDVDGGTHVALVLEEDPAADLHDWYGRYFYFAPDEIEPVDRAERGQREESRP